MKFSISSFLGLRGWSALAVALALLASSTPATALLIGDEVRFQCTNCVPPTDDTFIAMAGADLTLFDQFEVDVEDSTLRIDWIFDSAGVFNDLNFLWSDLDWVGQPGEIVNATIDQSSTWGLNGFLAFGPDSVDFTNNNDTTVATGDFLLINLDVNHVPEPSSVALLSVGAFACLLLARRRRAKTRA